MVCVARGKWRGRGHKLFGVYLGDWKKYLVRLGRNVKNFMIQMKIYPHPHLIINDSSYVIFYMRFFYFLILL